MKKIFLSFFLIISLIIPVLALADGGVTISVEAPQIEKDVNIPSQNVIIGWDEFDEKRQIMAISTGIKIKDFADLVWIIPIPSNSKPEVEKVNPEIFQQVPYLFSEIKKKSSGGEIFNLFLLVVFVVFPLFVIFKSRRVVFITLIIFIFISIILTSMGGSGSVINVEHPPIQVIEQKQIGVYDLAILKSTDAGFLVNWLNENGYKVSDESIPILQEYSSKPNFYFIVNKISQETLNRKDLLGELATPLQITFQPDQPFYPLKMSSINGGRTIINVYFFSDNHPFRDKSEILSIKKSRNIQATRNAIYRSRNEEARNAMYSLFPNSYYAGDIYSVFFDKNVITWLRYEGDLKDLRQDAYFGFDSITCDALIKKDDDEWPYVERYAKKCYEKAESIYYKDLAISEKNPSLCEKTKSKNKCYEELALILDDFSLCEKLSTNKGSCYRKFIYKFKNSSDCKKMLTQYSKDICIDYFAVHNKDFFLCDNIIGESIKNDCYDRAAFYTENFSIWCEKITIKEKRNSCYERQWKK